MSITGLTPLLFLTAAVISTVKCSTQANCIQGVNCHLPQCSCSSYASPLSVGDTPQIIFFGFDDALNGQMALHYRKLFSSDRRNPDNCPISMSLYVQHAYTDYRLVREFYKKGMEIGVHSVTHTDIDTEKKLADEAEHQKSNLASLGGVPKEEIVGWRSPNLKTAGDSQPPTLQKLGYTYDISLTYTVGKRGQKKPWPYTLDYGYPYHCQIDPCPRKTSSYRGFWEVPVISLMDYKGAYACAYVDGCYNSPTTEEDAFTYLMKNFQDNYETRTPLGFNMHAAWFERPHNLAAMDRFIKEMTKKDDVFIVSVQKMLEWMKSPTKLSELHKLSAWGCKSATQIRSSNNVISAPASRTAHPPYPTPRPVIAQQTPKPKCWWWTGCGVANRVTKQTTQKPNTHRQSRVTSPWWDKKTTRKVPEVKNPRQSTIVSPWWQRKSTQKRIVKTDRRTTSLPKTTQERKCPWFWCRKQTTNRRYFKVTTTTQPPTTKQPRYFSPRTRYWEVVKTTRRQTKSPSWWRRTSLPIKNDATQKKDTPKNTTPAPTHRSIFSPPSSKFCIQGRTCRLPSCQCRSLLPPGGLPVNRVPQMIYFSFDGPLNQRSYPYYSLIFNNYRKNPNNCPISATFFVSKRGNFVPYLTSNVKKGLEIAIQGEEPRTNRYSRTRQYDFEKELQYMLTKLPVTSIVGWRSPSMKPYGEVQYKALRDNNMLYDSTLATGQASGNLPWPYTLDFRWQGRCMVGGCPRRSYPGLWEIPVKPLLDVKKLYPCVYADGCMNNPWTAEDTFDYLMDNFMKYYQGNRSPMGISLRQTWFSHPVYRPNVKGLIKFIDKILSMGDVYIVSIRQLIQWLQQPTPLDKMQSFAPWRC